MDNIKEFDSASGGGKGSRWVIIILCLLLLLCIGFYVKLHMKFNTQEEDLTATIEERVSLTAQYENLLTDYEGLETSNDTLSTKLSQEQERIKELILKIRSIKSRNSSEVNQYKKELKTLRDIMKGFVHQIDSLNTLNIELTAENKEIKKQYNSAKKNNTDLQNNLKAEKNKVAIASIIKAVKINVEAYNSKAKPTLRAKKIKRFAVSFVLDENAIAPKGVKSVFIRITNPNDHVLMQQNQPMFNFDGEQIAYTSIREIEYNGDATSATIYYENNGEKLLKGLYKVDIFCDGTMVGSSSINLK